MKLQNRYSYQELIFKGLGFRFSGETYLLPETIETSLRGDVAIAPEAGPVWPMKNWAYYDMLQRELEGCGLTVNVLPLPGVLTTAMSPPSACAKCREIASPSPEPPYCRLIVASPCPNG